MNKIMVRLLAVSRGGQGKSSEVVVRISDTADFRFGVLSLQRRRCGWA
jgi:hypothetical protein